METQLPVDSKYNQEKPFPGVCSLLNLIIAVRGIYRLSENGMLYFSWNISEYGSNLVSTQSTISELCYNHRYSG